MSAGISIPDISHDLLTLNELGDGEWEYFTKDGRLFLRRYGDGNDAQKVTAVYRIGITIEQQETTS